jgi:membrane-associated HD superfamily phosphohydrolase
MYLRNSSASIENINLNLNLIAKEQKNLSDKLNETLKQISSLEQKISFSFFVLLIYFLHFFFLIFLATLKKKIKK